MALVTSRLRMDIRSFDLGFFLSYGASTLSSGYPSNQLVSLPYNFGPSIAQGTVSYTYNTDFTFNLGASLYNQVLRLRGLGLGSDFSAPIVGTITSFAFGNVYNRSRVERADFFNIDGIFTPAETLRLAMTTLSSVDDIAFLETALAGNDVISLSARDDVMNGFAGDDKMFGQRGDDMLYGDAGRDVLYGGAGDDVQFGGAGNDTLYGANDNDVLHGDDNEDLVYGGNGHDTIYGGAGNDSLFGLDGNDIVYGGDGRDLLISNGDGNHTLYGGNDGDVLRGITNDSALLFGDAGNDTLDGESASDTLFGGEGSDLLRANAGDDDIIVGAGDRAFGGNGDDEFYVDATLSGTAILRVIGGEAGEDSFDATNNSGGRVGDVLDLRGLAGVVVFPDAGNAEAGRAVYRNSAGERVTIYYSEIEHVLWDRPRDLAVNGTDEAEYMGNSLSQYFDAEGDSIDGPDGLADTIYANGGADSVDSGAGADLVYGGAGDDLLYVGDGDQVYGGAGEDVFFASAYSNGIGSATVEGGADGEGASGDRLDLRGFADVVVSYNPENSESGTATFTNLDGQALTITFWEIENVLVDAPHDYAVNGTEDAEYMAGGEEAGYADADGDFIDGPDGLNDTIFGNGGSDYIVSGSGNDLVFGGEGGDYVQGIDGDDTLYGDAGSDYIVGGAGADLAFGGAGDDLIYIGDGDQLFGGADDDLFYFYVDGTPTSIGAATVVGGEADEGPEGDPTHNFDGRIGDYLDLRGLSDVMVAYETENAEAGIATFTNLDGQTVTITFLEIEHVLFDVPVVPSVDGTEESDNMGNGEGLYADADGDYIDGPDGLNDTIYGNGGSDTIAGGDGGDVIYGGAGDNGTYFDEYYYEFITGIGDIIYGGYGDDLVYGGDGNDYIYGEVGDDSIFGEAGNDLIFANIQDTYDDEASVDMIYGGGDSDTIWGAGGQGAIYGDGGDDQIWNTAWMYGGLGDDRLSISAINHGVTQFGGEGRDNIAGGNLNDVIYGGDDDDSGQGNSGNDLIYGGDGADLFFGNRGDDTLYGGAGNDTLLGNVGQDFMYGGEGRDLFGMDYNPYLDAVIPDYNADLNLTDVIFDFVSGQDRIELYPIDANRNIPGITPFIFNGTTPHSNPSHGEVYYEIFDNDGKDNDYTVVYLDNDADSASEALIKLIGLHTLTAGDFVL